MDKPRVGAPRMRHAKRRTLAKERQDREEIFLTDLWDWQDKQIISQEINHMRPPRDAPMNESNVKKRDNG